MQSLPFVKMHGLGNDFVVIEQAHYEALSPKGVGDGVHDASLAELARTLCDRRYGVGGDGLIVIAPSEVAHYRMRMFNPDGSEAEMCGNGLRCAAGYVARTQEATTNTARDADPAQVEAIFEDPMGPPRSNAAPGTRRQGSLAAPSEAAHPEVQVETGAGVLVTQLVEQSADGLRGQVRVNMGEPRLQRSQIPMLGEAGAHVLDEALTVDEVVYVVNAISMGNPHCVLFLDAQRGTPIAELHTDEIDLATLGAAIEHLPTFPQGTNVEIAELIDRDTLRVRVWERGAGLTLACGTGACATMAAAFLTGRVGRRAQVHLPGGPLQIDWRGSGPLTMTGPYAQVFAGSFPLAALK